MRRWLIGILSPDWYGDDPEWDARDAEALYDLLENEVIPEFYTRDEQGMPAAWVARMRESMACLTPHFSSNRAVREYTEQHYFPAAAAYVNGRSIRAQWARFWLSGNRRWNNTGLLYALAK